MFKKSLLLSMIFVFIFSLCINSFASDYTFTQQSGVGYFVSDSDKADALEDQNELRTIVNDLGALLVHSKMDGLYPKDLTTGGTIQIPEAGLKFGNAPANDDIAAYIEGEMTWQTKAELGLDLSLYYLKTAIDTQGEVETIWGVTLATDSELAALKFTDLSDTPANYTDQAGKYVKVNAGEDALEFGTPAGAGDMTKVVYDTDTDDIVDKAENIDDGAGNSSTAVDVKDAVTKKHTQNTDTILVFTNALADDHTYSGEVDSQSVGESVVFGDLLYFNWTDVEWKKAKADAFGTTPALRIALESKADGETCLMLVKGYIRDDSAFDFGASRIFLNDDTAGTCDDTAPAESGDQIQVVGTAKSADILFFNPGQDVGEI